MAITSTSMSTKLPVGPAKIRRKSNSVSTHASSSTVDGSGSGAGRKGKAKAKESWDDDFVFSRPPPKQANNRAREPSPVPSFADSAIWGDESDAEDVDDTIKLSAQSHITPEESFKAVGTMPDGPPNRLVKKQKSSLVLIRPQEHRLGERREGDDEPSAAALAAMQASSRLVIPVPLKSSTVPGKADQTAPGSATEPGKSKGVGRLLGKMSKRFSGTPTGLPSPLAIPSDDQSRIRRPRSSTTCKDSKPPVSRTPSIRRSSSSVLRTSPPSSLLVASQSPYPSPPPSSHTSKGFHLPSPSPRSPYHSAASLHGSTLFPTRTTSHQSDSIPPLPTSASYPVLTLRASDSEREEAADPAQTPRRKKARPVSIQVSVNKKASFREAGLGLGQASNDGWRPNWKGPTPAAEASRKKSETSITFEMPLTPTAASKPQTALRRLGSLSKKHGRKLSGGWKFGSTLTLAAALSDPPPLPTVVASPANRPDPPSASASGRISDSHVTPDEIKVIESWAVPDEEPFLNVAEKRRSSWNDLLIPRDVLAKQKELKAGMSAVRRFAKGVESLKRLKEEHFLLGQGGVDEYAQWWEIAEVLIEVGSTSAAPASDNEMWPPAKAFTRERRITLASSAGVPVRKVVSPPARLTTPRASSDTVYHDAASGGEDSGPPKAGLPEHWRASTGRHDLSKRQLQVLQSMLTSSASTSFTEARATGPFDQTTPVALPTGQRRLERPRPLPITLPSPSESTPFFPSSTAAASMMNKGRRPSRAGLQGLKDFVRSLRTSSSSVPVKIIESPPSTPVLAASSPPVSYARQAGADSTRSSLSAFGRNHASAPGSESHRRPSVRAMFRTSTVGSSSMSTDEGAGSRRSIKPASHAATLGRDGSRNPESPKLSSAQSLRIRSGLGPVHDPDATIRLSNRRAATQTETERPCETDSGRSTSARSAPVDSRLGETGPDGLYIALTPENLGPLLEALKACEAKLQECLRTRRGERGL